MSIPTTGKKYQNIYQTETLTNVHRGGGEYIHKNQDKSGQNKKINYYYHWLNKIKIVKVGNFNGKWLPNKFLVGLDNKLGRGMWITYNLV